MLTDIWEYSHRNINKLYIYWLSIHRYSLHPKITVVCAFREITLIKYILKILIFIIYN